MDTNFSGTTNLNVERITNFLKECMLISYDWHFPNFVERCPDVTGYVFSKAFNSCYKVHVYDTTLRYDDYSQICKSEGGELMKIDSDEKQQHIVIFLGLYVFLNIAYAVLVKVNICYNWFK